MTEIQDCIKCDRTFEVTSDSGFHCVDCRAKTEQPDEELLDILNDLETVLCDLEGLVCIAGSDGDRAVIQNCLARLYQFDPKNGLDKGHLQRSIQDAVWFGFETAKGYGLHEGYKRGEYNARLKRESGEQMCNYVNIDGKNVCQECKLEIKSFADLKEHYRVHNDVEGQ